MILAINNDTDNDDDDDYYDDCDDDDDNFPICIYIYIVYTHIPFKSYTSAIISFCVVMMMMMMNSLPWVHSLAAPQIAFRPPPARATLALPERLGMGVRWDILRDIMGLTSSTYHFKRN